MTACSRPLAVVRHGPPPIPAVVVDYLPIVIGPAAAWGASAFVPPWIVMWCMALAVYFGMKWLVWRRTRTAPVNDSSRRFHRWFWLWPGMDPAPFFQPGSITAADFATPRLAWCAAVAKTAAGVALVGLVGPRVLPYSCWAAGWLGMVGLILLLHSGSFHLAALVWQRAGVGVEGLMNAPLRARSLADFWGRRWNRAFRDLVDPLIFRPLVRRYGTRVASWGVFLFSGLVHDLVITVPAGGGYGLPTLYFLLQAAVIELTHSRLGRRWKLGSGARARLLAAVTLITPLGLLAPRPFVENCIVPMMRLWT